MDYQKNSMMGGKWLKGIELVDASGNSKPGIPCKLTSEVHPEASQFKNKDGSPQTQDVAKIQLQGYTEELNVKVNRASINALVEAFGSDSNAWINKPLLVEAEKQKVAGKTVFPIFLIPAGYHRIDDTNGYTTVAKIGAHVEAAPVADDGDISLEELPF